MSKSVSELFAERSDSKWPTGGHFELPKIRGDIILALQICYGVNANDNCMIYTIPLYRIEFLIPRTVASLRTHEPTGCIPLISVVLRTINDGGESISISIGYIW